MSSYFYVHFILVITDGRRHLDRVGVDDTGLARLPGRMQYVTASNQTQAMYEITLGESHRCEPIRKPIMVV